MPRRLTVERIQRRAKKARREGIIYADIAELVRDEEEEERGVPLLLRKKRRERGLVVTGAAGRVGSEVVPSLLGDFDVIGIVKELSHAHHLLEHIKHAAAHKKPKALKIVQDGLDDEKKLAAMLSRVSQVIHLAGSVDYDASLDEMVDRNVKPTMVVANACKRAGVDRLILASSTSVFRKPQYLPIDESHPYQPANAYGQSKALSEEAVKVSGVPYVVARFPIIYGKTFKEGFGDVISMTEKGKMPIIGQGRNRISFIHIDDVVHAFGRILLHKEIRNEEFNFVGETRTQEDCFRAIARALGVEPPKKRVPRSVAMGGALIQKAIAKIQGKPPKFRPEYVSTLSDDRYFTAEKARRMLGFRPSVTLEEGIRAYLERKGEIRGK